MDSYIRYSLVKDEKVLARVQKNKLCYLSYVIMAIVGLIVLIVGIVVAQDFPDWINGIATDAGEEAMPSFIEPLLIVISIMIFGSISLPLFLVGIFRIVSVSKMQLVVTNRRILGKRGVIAINAMDIPIEKIDSVSLKAGFFGRIFHYYTISIHSMGSGTPVNQKGGNGGINFYGVSNAMELKNAITAAIETHAEEARNRQAEAIAAAMERRS